MMCHVMAYIRLIVDVAPPPSGRESSTRVSLTPRQARELLEQSQHSFQRGQGKEAAGQATVKRYADDMLRGTWHLSTITIGVVVDRFGDRFWLINGKHRLNALLLAAESKPHITIPVMLEMVSRESEDQIRALTLVQDIGKSRTARDLIEISGLELNGIDQGQIAKLQAAINILIQGFGKLSGGTRQRIPQETYEHALVDWAPFFRFWMEATTIDDESFGGTREDRKQLQRALNSAQMIALGLVTFRSQPEIARAFWSHVACGANTAGTKSNTWRAYDFLVSHYNDRRTNPALALRYVAQVYNNSLLGVPIDAPGRNYHLDIEGAAAIRPHDDRVVVSGIAIPLNRVPLRVLGSPYDGVTEAYYTPTERPLIPLQEEKRLVAPKTQWTQAIYNEPVMPAAIAEQLEKRRLAAEEAKRKQEERKAQAEQAARAAARLSAEAMYVSGRHIPDVTLKSAGLRLKKGILVDPKDETYVPPKLPEADEKAV